MLNRLTVCRVNSLLNTSCNSTDVELFKQALCYETSNGRLFSKNKQLSLTTNAFAKWPPTLCLGEQSILLFRRQLSIHWAHCPFFRSCPGALVLFLLKLSLPPQSEVRLWTFRRANTKVPRFTSSNS